MHPLISTCITLYLLYRAYTHASLTLPGIAAAAVTATIHALHPWATPFALLGVFYVGGTRATKVKADVKASLTLSAAAGGGGEGPRTHVQVLANSVCASVLILLHRRTVLTAAGDGGGGSGGSGGGECFGRGGAGELLMVGIVSNYAAVAADTFSSELGILSASPPRLITTLRTVAPGTNGGVTVAGLLAGVLGSFTIAATSAVLLPFCASGGRHGGGWDAYDRLGWVLAITVWGTLGSVLDSLLGAVLQASVVDRRTGKIVEGSGGTRVLTHAPGSPKRKSGRKGDEGESRIIVSGADLLDNNQINLLMAAVMSLGGMVVASYWWKIPLRSILL